MTIVAPFTGNLQAQSAEVGRRARAAAQELASVPTNLKNAWLLAAADSIEAKTQELLAANACDLARTEEFNLSPAQVDRLMLSPVRLAVAAEGLRQVAALPDPVGRVIERDVRPNGLRVTKVGVPLGVILFLYESRPNVTVDAAALAIKSGNAIILRGGKEAIHSNTALHRVLADALKATGLNADAVQFVETPDREVVGELLRLKEFIDLAIPRGGDQLIERVCREATMPVLKHYRGNCHVYVDQAADLAMATRIVVNAKCQRPGVCNATESLLVHREVAEAFLRPAAAELRERGVELRGCPRTLDLIDFAIPATEADFAAEYNELILSIKIVDSLDDAIEHIRIYGSAHTDAIVTSDSAAADRFVARVDSAAVMVNASTRFNDGFELGLGAEIGISTDKLHARGPCGLRELTSYKYVVVGEGQVRE